MAETRQIVLQLPADHGLLRVARVAVASAAAELPFTLEEVEDLRIAVDELAAVVIEGAAPDAVLTITMEVGAAEVAVSGRVAGGPVDDLHPVARDLLAMVAPGHQLEVIDGERRFRFARQAGVGAR